MKNLKRSLLGCIAIVFAASASACVMEPFDEEEFIEEDIGNSSEPLYVATSRLWDDRDVPVCWDFSGFATEKRWIKETMRGQRAWSAVGNINFVGWGNCQSSSDGIRLVNDDSMYTSYEGSHVEISFDLRSDIHKRYTRCIENNLNRQSCIRVVGMHEFGHAIGYAHEHNRPDTPDSCDEAPQGSDGDSTYGAWDLESIMNYCDPDKELSPTDRVGTSRLYGQRSAAAPRLHDYNGDGRDDLMCHDVVNGRKWIDYANSNGRFLGTNWSREQAWCGNDTERLFSGDFNGDGREDMLCHDIKNGRKWIDFANSTGGFGGTEWSRNSNWCQHEAARLFVGDYNGDGRDDLLCHDRSDGRMWIDFANTLGKFHGTDWFHESNWCDHENLSLYVGDFNGDGRDDLVCHSVVSGRRWVDLANANGQFLGVNSNASNRWCAGSTEVLHIGDYNGDGRDDLLCHSARDGTRWLDYANASGQFSGTDTTGSSWCKRSSARLFTGDVNGDGRDDHICHDVVSGMKWIDFASTSGQFNGTNWSRNGSWCDHDGGELH